MGEPVRLHVQQAVERVEAARLAGDAVQTADARVDERADVRARALQRRETTLHDLLFARANGDRLGIAIAARREVARRGENALQLVGVAAVVLLEPALHRLFEHSPECVGRDRQRLVVVADEERAVAIGQPQFLPLEDRAVLIAENRDQDLVGELVLHRMPFDVEEAREARARSVLEHVEPPRVRRLRDAHVVRHEVHDLAHPARVHRFYPRPVVRVGANLRVETGRVGDVVAVRAVRDRLQIRRGVAIGDAEGV